MTVIINILPNIYWIYNNPINQKSTIDYKIDMRKMTESNKIKSIIELDEKFGNMLIELNKAVPIEIPAGTTFH
jgi:hypothetical protein